MQNTTQPTENQSTAWQRLQKNELRMQAGIILRWLWLIVLCILVGGLAAFVYSRLSPPIFEATSFLLVNEARTPASANYQDILTSERISSTYSEMIGQRPVLEEVAKVLQIEGSLYDAGVIDIDSDSLRDTQLIRIDVEGTSPSLVAAVANTLPRVFIDRIQEIQSARYASSKLSLQTQLLSLDEQITTTENALDAMGIPQNVAERAEMERLQELLVQYENSYTTLLERFEELRLVEAQSIDSITITEEAEVPDSAIRPRTLINTLLGAIAGAMLALSIVFLLEYLDDRIRSPDDLMNTVGTAWMGTIGEIPGAARGAHTPEVLISAKEPRHPITEAFRRLRTNLQFSQIDTGLPSLMLTSARPGEGKSTTAANLATVMAQSGLKVVLVDGDLRRPVQHKVFERPASPGLTDALLHADSDGINYLWETDVPNLQLMTSGSRAPNPAELVGSQRMEMLLSQLQRMADVVIIDAPPVLAVTDAQVLGRLVSGVLLVVDAASTTRSAAAGALEALDKVGVNLLGAVVNRLQRSEHSYYYYYSDYYYAEEGPTPPPPAHNGPSRNGPPHNGNGNGHRAPTPSLPPAGVQHS